MDSIDSQGTVPPIAATDQDIVTKKIAQKNGQGQGAGNQPRKKAAPDRPPEEDDDTRTEKHAIDIVV